jgi:hypothetical protein
MESLLFYFADIFKLLTSFLLVWGIYACGSTVRMMLFTNKQIHKVRKVDLNSLVCISVCTVLCFLLLFVFPEFASRNMFPLFLFEFWYTCFSIYFTSIYLNPRLDICFHHQCPTTRSAHNRH